MGDEIAHSDFHKRDFADFDARLRSETALLGRWFERGGLSGRHAIIGIELEAWLIDANGRPAPINETFLARLADPLVVPELAQYNVELNTTPRNLSGRSLGELETEVAWRWSACRRAAADLDARPLLIGILPSVREADLSLAHMSPRIRYRALNEQIMRLRAGRPIELDISGSQHLRCTHGDVMLEAAATSLQVHLQVSPDLAVRYFNAALIASGLVLAACGNAPYLFGRELWEETRLPLFEQAVAVAPGEGNRVSFGNGYARTSLFECFVENLSRFAVLLPERLAEPAERLPHLRLHNGTIWPWVRPLIGFDEDGTPHLRIEMRSLPAGPGLVDTVANTALMLGLVEALARRPQPPEALLPFEQARTNLYLAARHGLEAHLHWLGDASWPADDLLTGELLPLAAEGLAARGVAGDDIDRYLGVIAARIASRQTGAAWQRAWVARHGHDMAALTLAYADNQDGGAPVHEWVV